MSKLNELICKKCNKVFSTKQSLKRHLNRKYLCTRKIICNKCGLEFDTTQHLINHKNMKKDCLIKKINTIQKLNEELSENFINYSTLIDKIYDLANLIKMLEKKNSEILKEIINLLKDNFIDNKMMIKILCNKILINEVTILKKIKKIDLLEEYCTNYMLSISTISNKQNNYQEVKNKLDQINKIGMKELPKLNYQLWKNYKEFHNYFQSLNKNLLYCKFNEQIICIKNNSKIIKFELGKVLLSDIM